MNKFHRTTVSLVALGWLFASSPAPAHATESSGNVVDAAAISARIDQKLATADADRKILEDFLAREDVRQAAGAAGLDMSQATARVGTLSDAERHDLANRASAILNDVGGSQSVVISVTAIIIIVLLIILL